MVEFIIFIINSNMEALKAYPWKIRLLIIGGVVLVLALIFFLNWSFYKLLGFFFGSMLSVVLIFSFYYYQLRYLVIALAYPGITTLMRRSLEHDFGKRMTQQVLISIIDLKNCLEMFQGSVK